MPTILSAVNNEDSRSFYIIASQYTFSHTEQKCLENIKVYSCCLLFFCTYFRQKFRTVVSERQFFPLLKINYLLLGEKTGNLRKIFVLHSTLSSMALISPAKQTVQSYSPKRNVLGQHFMKTNGGVKMTVLKLSSQFNFGLSCICTMFQGKHYI